MPFRGRGWRLEWDWMTAGTTLVLGTLSGLLLFGCGAGNVPGMPSSAGTGRADALPVTDASREFRLVVQFDHIQELLLDPALTEEGRLSSVASAYRANHQPLALLLEQRYPREPPIDSAVRQATALPLGAGEPYPVRSAQIQAALQRLFYLALKAELADAVEKLTDTNPANDTDLVAGAPRHWDRAWAYYHALDDIVQRRTSANPIEFPQFAGTLHETMVKAFLDGQNAILFGSAGTAARTAKKGSGRARILQYGGGTPGGTRPGTVRPTGPDVAGALRNERLIRTRLVQLFYLSVIREATELVLRLESNDVPTANAARARALEYYRALFTLVEQEAGTSVAENLLNLLNAPVSAPSDFPRAKRDTLVNDLNQALSRVLAPEERVSAVQLQQRGLRGL